jgi:superfamily I DNA/RNA helicase
MPHFITSFQSRVFHNYQTIIPELRAADSKLLVYNKTMQPTHQQSKILNRPLTSKVFLQGPAGTGKTTTGIFWLKKLLDEGVPPQDILIFVPQRTLALPYENALRQSPDHLHEVVNTITLGGLARRMVDLYWPLVSEASGVGNPNLPPHFLTMETAQYFMAHLVHPLIENEGAFESLTLNRNRIYAQIIDNLNKSAIVGFPYQDISQKLKAAWIGDVEQLHIYDNVQQCANLFRQFCLENNLLDFSLQVDIFRKYLWPSTLCQKHLKRTYRHLIVDNVEEDTPAAHDLLKAWLPAFESALVIFDEDGGFRFFLGADPQSGAALRLSCQQTLRLEKNLVNSDGLEQLKFAMQNTLARFQESPIERVAPDDEKLINALVIPEEKLKYFPAMISWTARQIQSLIEEGVPPSEIVVLAQIGRASCRERV